MFDVLLSFVNLKSKLRYRDSRLGVFRRGLKEGKIARERGGERYKSAICQDVLLAEIRQVCRTEVSQVDGIVRKILQDVMPMNRT